MLLSLLVSLLFGVYILFMAAIFFSQFLLTSGHETWVHTSLRKFIGPRGFRLLMTLYPQPLRPLGRLISLVAGLLTSVVFVFYILILLAMYLDINPLGIKLAR